jgi:hypothetical protein
MQSEQEAMRAVILASAAGGVLDKTSGQPFLVVNPKYHNGSRASFIVLPNGFYEDVLLREMHVGPAAVRSDAGGRLCTVTHTQLVLTVTTDRSMVHVMLGPENWKSGSEPEPMSLRKLFEEAQNEGWAVSPEAHQALFDQIAKEHALTSQWKFSVRTEHLMRSPGGSS